MSLYRNKTGWYFFTKYEQETTPAHFFAITFEGFAKTFKNKLIYKKIVICKSSCPKAFCKKGVRKNSAKSTGKQVCRSLSFNNVAGLRNANLSKKRLWHRCFVTNFTKFLRTLFFIEHLQLLLLHLFLILKS